MIAWTARIALADLRSDAKIRLAWVRGTWVRRRGKCPDEQAGTRSFALARLRGHREAFLDPRLPQRCIPGDGSGGLIAVEVEAERHHDRAAEVEGAQGGGAGPRLVEPQQGVVRTLADVLHHAAQLRDARRG